MSQVNIYSDHAAYSSDTERLSTKSAVSLIESDNEIIYDGVNVVVGKAAADIGDCAVFDKTAGAIRFVKGATLSAALLPASLVPLAVVYARGGDKVLIVSLENASPGIRWAHPYEIALSGFDLSAGGTIVLTIGSGSSAGNVSITYAAGATLADVAAAINATLRNGAINYYSSNYGGWNAVTAENSIIMESNTYSSSYAVIDVVSGCSIRRRPDDANYQISSTGVIAPLVGESVRQNNRLNSNQAGCSSEKFLQYYAANGTVPTSNIPIGSATIVRKTSFETSEFCADLRAAYADYADYLFAEHMIEYPSVYGAMNRDGRTNTEMIGRMRFTDIRGSSAPCYPAAAAALDYGVTVEGFTTGLEAGAWWLPSVEDMYLLMRDRRVASDDYENDPVNRTLGRLGKTPCSVSTSMWTSCEYNYAHSFIYSGGNACVVYSNKANASNIRSVSAL